ncbi:U2 snRNP associated SURP motif containing [Trichuris trichiura]|uniref:U2 snRNP associated SURP motif containing n=1 Tax=Trichuris trichiura TaxID=36087 RepID=A0A077Z6I3_TRITR|nr:U2 snRNP associated SURP motif containing [Trichuris trichiura]
MDERLLGKLYRTNELNFISERSESSPSVSRAVASFNYRYQHRQKRRKTVEDLPKPVIFAVYLRYYVQEEEERAKEVLQEFVATFEQSDSKIGKTFVRGGVVNPAENDNKSELTEFDFFCSCFCVFLKFMEEAAKNRPKKPVGFVSRVRCAQKYVCQIIQGKGVDGKRMSNLEAFKEELKRTQEERAERKRLREQLQEFGIAKEPLDQIAPPLDNPYMANAYDLDPTTTNLFLANLSPEINEEEIRCLFGKYGPLASVKIMWPRNGDERVKPCLTGFVAYMTRKDAERAVSGLKGLSNEFWGKPVVIPHYPVYVPKAMLDLIAPPPASGLPFNAQPDPAWLKVNFKALFTFHLLVTTWSHMIRNAVVKVVIPTERSLLCLIHRVIEFVIREGPMFEAMLMWREKDNPSFSFLFDNQSPGHVYYRWKLFSVLQAHTFVFALFTCLLCRVIFVCLKTVAFGYPRQVPNRIPRNLLMWNYYPLSIFSSSQRRELESALKVLNLERKQVGNGMMWCVEHCEAAEEIVDIIAASFSDPDLPLLRKIARLYLLSDILANCTAKVLHVSLYRKYIGNRLEDIFRSLNVAYKSITARLRADQIKQRVMSCVKMWEESAVYTSDFLSKLENIFLGRFQEVGLPCIILWDVRLTYRISYLNHFFCRPLDEAESIDSTVLTESKGQPSLQKEELSDEKRLLLREVEVKVVQYQDQLESGNIKREKGLSIAEQKTFVMF